MPLDTSETQELINAAKRIPDEILPKARAIMQKGAVEMKKNLQEDARGSKYFKQFAKKITYDTKIKAKGVELEIGPENEKTVGKGGGPGAAIAYFGGANGGGGTLDLDTPVENEFPNIDEYMKKLGDVL